MQIATITSKIVENKARAFIQAFMTRRFHIDMQEVLGHDKKLIERNHFFYCIGSYYFFIKNKIRFAGFA